MKKIVIFFVSLILISCGGGNNNNSTSSNLNCSRGNIYNNNPPEPNVIKLQIKKSETCISMEGVTVQLDDNGEVLFSDKNGKIKFTNLSGFHDIHVFSPTGYGWHSFYNINVDSGFFQLLELYNFDENGGNYSPDIKSYIKFKGNIQNSKLDSDIGFVYFSDKQNQYNSYVTSNANSVISYEAKLEYTDAIGTNVNNELWILEQVTDPITKSRYLADAVQITPVLPVKTTDLNGSAIVTDVEFSATPKPKNLLMQFKSIKIPVGLTVDQFDISGYITSSVVPDAIEYVSLFSAPQLDLSKPLTFSTYTSPFTIKDNLLSLIVGASADKQIIGGAHWGIFSAYSVGAKSIKLIPKVSVIPNLIATLPGREISWSQPNFLSIFN